MTYLAAVVPNGFRVIYLYHELTIGTEARGEPSFQMLARVIKILGLSYRIIPSLEFEDDKVTFRGSDGVIGELWRVLGITDIDCYINGIDSAGS